MKKPSFANPIWINAKMDPGEFFMTFTRRFSELMSSTKARETITVYINSQGGDTHTSLAVYDLLKSCNRTTVGIVSGTAQSAASVVLQACKTRLMTPNSSMMLHKTRVRLDDSIENCQSALRMFKQMEETFFHIYAERSGQEESDIAKMAHIDKFFDAQEALQYGLIDAVLE